MILIRDNVHMINFFCVSFYENNGKKLYNKNSHTISKFGAHVQKLTEANAIHLKLKVNDYNTSTAVPGLSPFVFLFCSLVLFSMNKSTLRN